MGMLLRSKDKLLLMLKRNLMPGELDLLQTRAQFLNLSKRELTQMVILSTTESSPIPFSRLTLTLSPPDKLPSMPKKNQMPGETDLLLTLDQSLTMSKREQTQMVTPSTTESSPIPFSRLTLTPRPPDKLLLMLKKNQMLGETDLPLTLDQSLTTSKREPIQMVIPSIMESFQTQSLRLTPMLRPPDKLLSMPKKNQMPGETDLPLTQDQLITMSKREPTQMVTPSTTVSFLTQSSRLTPMLRLPELLPLMPKRNQMPGETDGLLTQDQLSTMSNRELTQMVILITTEYFQTQSLRHTPMLRLQDKLQLMLKKNPMHGEMDGLQILVQSYPLLKAIET